MIKKALNYFGFDGLSHIVLMILFITILRIFIPSYLAVIVGVLFGLGKEFVYDKLLKQGTFEKKDLIADGVGVLIAILSILV